MKQKDGNMKRIFFVEDDASLRKRPHLRLAAEGLCADHCTDLRGSQSPLAGRRLRLVILDVSLPDGSGFDLCRMIRQSSRVPILFLTAADEETDIIMGLDIGGDDYITKPFKLAVFLSRVNALLRRSGNFSQPDAELHSHGIDVQRLQRKVFKNQTPVELTTSEYRLLCLFMENPGQVLSPEQILGRLWDCEENFLNSNTLTVYIRRLRAKIEDDPSRPQRIVTVRGMGYKWNAGEEEK